MRGSDLISEFLHHSPFVNHLGIELRELDDDRAVLLLPFRDEVVTIAGVIHGGAVSSLVDNAAVAAAWSALEFEEPPLGTTVGLTVDFLAAARNEAIVAEAHVLRRGSSLCFCEVKVRGADNDHLLATGLVTYKLTRRD
jgi:uncharacterized protein (TIGR00369 family)